MLWWRKADEDMAKLVVDLHRVASSENTQELKHYRVVRNVSTHPLYMVQRRTQSIAGTYIDNAIVQFASTDADVGLRDCRPMHPSWVTWTDGYGTSLSRDYADRLVALLIEMDCRDAAGEFDEVGDWQP